MPAQSQLSLMCRPQWGPRTGWMVHEWTLEANVLAAALDILVLRMLGEVEDESVCLSVV
jgi:hypothetical protein